MRAVAYLRISQDDTHEGLGVARQRRDAEAVTASAGWDLVEVIDENDTSAFRQPTVTLPDRRQVRRTVRPGFDRLLAGLRKRRWQALVVYHLDRLARQPRDLEDIVEQVEHSDIGKAARSMISGASQGAAQADGSVRSEPLMDVAEGGRAVRCMAGLPLDANVAMMTAMATKMPYVGRG